jgi:hypothetical protein
VFYQEIKDPKLHEIGKNGISLGFKLLASDGTDLIDTNNYLTFSVRQVVQTYMDVGGVSTPNRNKYPLQLVKCGDNFKYDDQDEVKRLGIDNYW